MVEQTRGQQQHRITPAEKATRLLEKVTSGSFDEVRAHAEALTARTRRALRGMGEQLREQITALPPGAQDTFYSEFQAQLQADARERRQLGSRLGAWIRNREKTGIGPEHLNPDGSLRLDAIRELPYFQDRQHLLDAYEGYQLSEKSKLRQAAREQHSQHDEQDTTTHDHHGSTPHDKQTEHNGHSKGDDHTHKHTCSHQHEHEEPISVEIVMHNEVRTLGRVGNWLDRQRALRRTKKQKTPHDDEHLATMQKVIAEEIPDVRETMSKRQQRKYDRLSEEQKAAFVTHIADIKAERALKPSLPRWWRNGAIAGNLGVGVAELFAGRVDKIATDESVTALLYDGGHNTLDALTYGGQADNVVNREITEETREKRRKFIYQLICAGSLLAAAKSGYHIQNDFFSTDGEFQQTYTALIAGSASLTLNTVLGTSMYRNFRRQKRLGLTNDEHKQDLVDHMKFDFAYAISAFSAGLFASKNLHIPVEDIISGAVSVFSAIRYRPTEKNLANAHTHNHEHSHPQLPIRERQPETAQTAEKRGSTRTWKPRRTVATGVALATAIPLAITGFNITDQPESQSPRPTETKSTISIVDDRAKTIDSRTRTASPVVNTSPTNIDVLRKQQTIKAGDTFWGIGEKQLSQFAPQTNWVNPENGVTRNDVIIDFARDMQEKQGSNLDTLFPGGLTALTDGLQTDDMAIIQEILTTTTYDEYKKLVPKVKAAYIKAA